MARNISFWRSSITSSMSGSADATVASLSANASTARWVCTLACAPIRSRMPRIARRQLSGVQAPCGPGDVPHQAGRELDLVEDAQHREQLSQVGGHRLLEREELVDAVLDLHDASGDLLVLGVDPLDQQEVGVEDRLGGGADLLAGLGRELDDVRADLLQLLVERPPGLGYGRVCVRVHHHEFASSRRFQRRSAVLFTARSPPGHRHLTIATGIVPTMATQSVAGTPNRTQCWCATCLLERSSWPLPQVNECRHPPSR